MADTTTRAQQQLERAARLADERERRDGIGAAQQAAIIADARARLLTLQATRARLLPDAFDPLVRCEIDSIDSSIRACIGELGMSSPTERAAAA